MFSWHVLCFCALNLNKSSFLRKKIAGTELQTNKTQNTDKQQATSNKQQATSNKQQATSNKQQATSAMSNDSIHNVDGEERQLSPAELRRLEIQAADEILERVKRSFESTCELAERLEESRALAREKEAAEEARRRAEREESIAKEQRDEEEREEKNRRLEQKERLIDQMIAFNAVLLERVRELETRNDLLADTLFVQQRENFYLRAALAQMTPEALDNLQLPP